MFIALVVIARNVCFMELFANILIIRMIMTTHISLNFTHITVLFVDSFVYHLYKYIYFYVTICSLVCFHSFSYVLLPCASLFLLFFCFARLHCVFHGNGIRVSKVDICCLKFSNNHVDIYSNLFSQHYSASVIWRSTLTSKQTTCAQLYCETRKASTCVKSFHTSLASNTCMLYPMYTCTKL